MNKLQFIFENKDTSELFAEYCKSEYSIENYACYYDIQEFKKKEPSFEGEESASNVKVASPRKRTFLRPTRSLSKKMVVGNLLTKIKY